MTETLKDLIDRRTALQGLLLHPGWTILCEGALAERENVLSTYEQPVGDLGGALAQEFSKGRAYQLKQLAGVPAALIDNLTIDIQSITQEIENGRRDDDSDPADDASETDPANGDRAP